MTQTEVYDELLRLGVTDPAVCSLSDQCIVGRWEIVSEHLPNGHICRVGRVGIRVLGEGATWDDAFAFAKKRLST